MRQYNRCCSTTTLVFFSSTPVLQHPSTQDYNQKMISHTSSPITPQCQMSRIREGLSLLQQSQRNSQVGCHRWAVLLCRNLYIMPQKEQLHHRSWCTWIQGPGHLVLRPLRGTHSSVSWFSPLSLPRASLALQACYFIPMATNCRSNIGLLSRAIGLRQDQIRLV